MKKYVHLTYIIRNDADLTFYRTENQMNNLLALYRKFDTLGLDPGPIRDVQYVMSPPYRSRRHRHERGHGTSGGQRLRRCIR